MQRNITIDYFKIVLSIFVVLIHMDPLFEGWDYLSILGWEISNGLSRIAVPCFFILSGYFFSSKIDKWELVKAYIRRLGIVYAVWAIIYLSFYSTIGWTSISFDSGVSLIMKFLLGYNHLWYLVALIEAALILYLINRIYSIKKFSLYIQVLLIIGLIALGYFIQSIYATVFGTGLYYYRNVIFFGLPFFWIGLLLRNKYTQINNINKQFLLVLLFLALVCLFVESYFSYFSDQRMDIFISLIIIGPILCLLVLNYSKEKKDYDAFLGTIIFLHILYSPHRISVCQLFSGKN